jgi:exodeoxyribonuclease V alpha subunit
MTLWSPPDKERFHALDLELARALSALGGEKRAAVLQAVATVSERTRQGHVCVRLEDLAQTTGASAGPADGAELGAMLASSALVGTGEKDTPTAPLVLSEERLYLARFFQHERAVEQHLSQLAEPNSAAPDAVDAPACLSRWFSLPSQSAVAAATLAERRLVVLTGGPGTGKTTTIARVLAFFADLCRRGNRPAPRVLLLAPTGKAAARMGEAVAALSAELSAIDSVAAALPTEARTVHRALGPTASPGRFVHGRDRPLLSDLVVVDEASMVDIALMRRLLDALSPEARLVLVGDEHQLSSVEAGAVLADVCAGASYQGWSSAHRAALERRFGCTLPGAAQRPRTRLSDCVVHLVHSFRFSPDRGVGRLARATLEGDADAALAVLGDPAHPEATLQRDGITTPSFEAMILAGFAGFCAAGSPQARLAALGRFRVLCAHRRGPRGVEALNRRIEALLEARGLLPPGAGRTQSYYAGRPLLITRNDSATRLFNGDMGVVVNGPSGVGVAFATDSGLRMIPTARLPAHESVFAMSIHKSQGSEVHSALVVLPDADSPLCTRELLYTAVTRVKSDVVLFGSDAAVRAAIERRVARASGLAARLAL